MENIQEDFTVKVGDIIVAHPLLKNYDPDFGDTVNLVIAKTDTGFVATNIARAYAIASIDDRDTPSEVLLGGPIQGLAVTIYNHTEGGLENSIPIGDTDYSVAALEAKTDVNNPPNSIRIIFGYAGWSDDQFRGELSASNAWSILGSEHLNNLFAVEPTKRYETATSLIEFEPNIA